MALLTITSENPDLSWVLVKNPESGMQVRKIRQGMGFGWFQETQNSYQKYNLFFQDGVDKDSFSNGDFEYLSKSKFCHPMAHASLLSEFLRDVWKGKSKKDLPYHNEVRLRQVSFRGIKLLQHISSHINNDNLTMSYWELEDGVYEISFLGINISLHELVCVVMVTCLFLSGDAGLGLSRLDEAFMTKYAKIIQDLDLSYYLRYVFARNHLRSKEQFDKFAPYLETDNIKLFHGDTGMQRLRFVESVLPPSYPVLDVGCGEGLFALNIPKKNPHPYHAVDIDESVIDVLNKKVKARNLDVTTYTSLDDYRNGKLVDILLVEVIEHMPLEEARELVIKLAQLNFNKLIITTPNRAFNHNYLLDDQFRHDDHDWEMTFEEFQTWMLDVLKETWFAGEIEFHGIGDTVNGISTTSGVVLTNADKKPQAIVTVGVSGSGKSTYARQITEKGDNWVEINRDDVRFRGKEKNWSKYKFTSKNESRVTEICNKRLQKATDEGKDVIISDTNLNSGFRKKLVTKLLDHGYQVTFKPFDVPLKELIERDQQRVGGVGIGVLMKQYQQWREYIGIGKYEPDESKPQAVVFDIDGTLASRGDRKPYEWHRVGEDEPRWFVIEQLLKYSSLDYSIVILSGRDGCCVEETMEWLKFYGIPYDTLAMRDVGDMRPDTEVKEEMFNLVVAPHYNVKAVVDDRPCMVRHWYVMGIPQVFCVANPWEEF